MDTKQFPWLSWGSAGEPVFWPKSRKCSRREGGMEPGDVVERKEDKGSSCPGFRFGSLGGVKAWFPRCRWSGVRLPMGL